LAAGPGGPAVGGDEAEREVRLRAHLEACADCHATFEYERQLYAAMDAALWEEVNLGVPGSLAARVHAAAETDAEQARAVFWRAPAFAALAVLSIVLAVFIGLRGRHGASPPSQTGVNAPSIARQTGAKQAGQAARAAAPAEVLGLGHSARAARVEQRKAAVREPPTLEVLVPPEERAALQQFISRVRQHEELGVAFLNSVAEKEDGPQHVAPLEFARLDVMPIEFEDED